MTATTDPIRQALDAYRAAVDAKDADAFAALYDEHVHVFDMWGCWQYEGIAAWRAMAAGWFGSLGDERVSVAFDAVEATVAGDLAFGHAIARFTALSAAGAELRTLGNRLTLVMQRRGGTWKIVHEHSSAPIDHESTKAMLQR